MGVLKEDLNEWQRSYRDQVNGITMYDIRDAKRDMLAAEPHAPVLGCDMKGNAVSVDLDAESPHVALSIASGGGKSVALRSLGAQLARGGAKVVVVDFKRHSHLWARDLAKMVKGVTYARDIHVIHETLLGIGAEGRKRNKLADDLSIEEYHEGSWKGQRIVVVVEELNAMMAELQDYWTEHKERGDSRRSPAVKAFHEILAMGRACNINIIAVAQRLSTESLGGSGGYGKGADARENFSTRVLGQYTMNTWRMLVPEVTYVASSEHKGRVQVVRNGKATETQVLFMNDYEAIDWVTH